MFKNEYIKFDENTNLCVYIWEPTTENIVGTVQLAHGMAEHLTRYDEFAQFLNNYGFRVIGADHYAHGKSVTDIGEIGVVRDYDFMESILLSIKLIRTEYDALFSGKKILFSHSMGSMAAQRYIELYPNDFEKVIISGTDYPWVKYGLAKLLTSGNGKKGKIVYSNFIHNMGVGSFNNKFKKENTTEVAWLSNDFEVQKKYLDCPMCGQMFPANYYHSLATMLLESKKKKNRSLIDRNLELMILSGKNDPVGAFGKGPMKLAKNYLKLGLNVHTKLYDNARHECLNELSDIKSKVYNDILSFIED